MRRWVLLDGLRGVAILLVLVSHLGAPGKGGPVGVTLFFVLSGFLITNLLITEQRTTGAIDLKAFYIRRAFRLLPALLVYLVGAGLLAAHFGFGFDWIWGETWPALAYVTNYVQALGTETYLHYHTWSLAVEEHFYVLWPLAVVVMSPATRLKRVAISVLLLACWRFVAGLQFDGWSYPATDTNAYALGAGCLVALLRERGFRFRFRDWHPLAGVVALCAASIIGNGSVRHPLVVVVAMGTVWACADAQATGVMASRPLRMLGRVSYSVYLWHVPLVMVATTSGGRVAAGIVTIAVAALSWRFIERPALAIRDRRWSATTKPSQPPLVNPAGSTT